MLVESEVEPKTKPAADAPCRTCGHTFKRHGESCGHPEWGCSRAGAAAGFQKALKVWNDFVIRHEEPD